MIYFLLSFIDSDAFSGICLFMKFIIFSKSIVIKNVTIIVIIVFRKMLGIAVANPDT